jgi:hypothetical protein
MQHPGNLALVTLAVSLAAACASNSGTSDGSDGGGAGGGRSTAGASGGRASGGAGGGASGGAGGRASGGAGGRASGGAGGGQEPARATLEPDQTMTCESAGTGVIAQHIEAECALGVTASGCKGSQQGTKLENSDTTVGYIEDGDYLAYDGVVLDGVTTLTAHYAKGTADGKIEVRLDSSTGKLIGSWSPTSTGDWNTWKDANVSLKASSGKHTLYLVASGSTSGIISLDWIELGANSEGGGSSAVFHINQIGFDTLGPKHAVVEGPGDLSRFFVVDSDGKAVWCGDLEALSFTDWGSTNSFYSVDFTGLTQAGTYRLQAGSSASKTFTIADNQLFKTVVPAVLGYYKASRADDEDVWAADAKVPFHGSDQTHDVRGGWYDASGDISKYLSHLSFANYMNPQQIPLTAWALAWLYDQPALASLGKGAAVQAEALWGADYLLRVLDPEGYFYINVFDGWSGDMGARTICAFEGAKGVKTDQWQSALREGGGMSIAALARVARWKVKGSFASDEYLAGAEKAFAALNKGGVKYADDGKENVIDDYTGLLAASELFATTGKSDYLDAARARATSLTGRLSSEGYFIADGASRPFWHASDAGLPVVALVRYTQIETDSDKNDAALQAIQKHLDYLLRVTGAVANPYGYARQHTGASRTSFFIPHENETGYWWQGENARLGSLAAAAALGAEALQASGSDYLDLLRFAGTQMDWLFGANPYDICFLHGSGTKNPAAYCGSNSHAGTLAGGMANGITGQKADGSGIQWGNGDADRCWDDWRWVEQWLPHSTWAMVAAAALAR